jgi:hypothetical protein
VVTVVMVAVETVETVAVTTVMVTTGMRARVTRRQPLLLPLLKPKPLRRLRLQMKKRILTLLRPMQSLRKAR